MATKIGIVNLAISQLGGDTITSFSEGTQESELANLHYDSVKDSCLSRHSWGFSLRRSILSQLQSSPLFGFKYQYQLPSDFLKVYTPKTVGLQYAISLDKLETDATTVSLAYQSREIDERLFSPLFITYIKYVLAAEFAEPLLEDSAKARTLAFQADKAFNEAQAQDILNNPSFNISAGSINQARYG